ncbi:MAG: 1,4-dihydroxy-2-naphthoate octaprenyltransferase [Anaerolineae bacterium]
MERIKFAVRVLRAPFFTASIVPVLLGAAIAWSEGGLHSGYLALTLLGALAVHAGLDVGNDYMDHLSGGDAANQETTPFSGGSRVIQEGRVTPRSMLRLSLLFYGITVLIGIYLAIVRGPFVLLVGVLGMLLAVSHNAPHVGPYYLAPGLGEAAVGLGFGPLMVLGSYYVQTQRVTAEAAWASVPIGLLIAAVLYINEFPDWAADKAAGRRTVVVVLGSARAVWGYVGLMVASYVAVVGGVLLGFLPAATLLGLLTLPLAWRGVRGALRHYDETLRLIPTNAITIQVHLLTGLLLSLGYVLTGVAT